MEMRQSRAWVAIALGLAVALVACGVATGAVESLTPAAPVVAASATAADSAGAAGAATEPVVTPTATPTPVPTPTTRPTATPFPTATPTPTATPIPTMAIAATAQRYAIVPEQSRATYRVGEKFFGQDLSVTIATTTAVAGNLYIDPTRPSASSAGAITVDLSKLRANIPGHDDARSDFLDVGRYPKTTFVPKRLEGLPDDPYAEGQELTFRIVGDLTVRTVTKEVTFDGRGKIEGDTFTGTATARIQMTSFGLQPPRMTALEIDDNVNLELEITARRAP
jgi:polyisoprenoid-binding protein YceI